MKIMSRLFNFCVIIEKEKLSKRNFEHIDEGVKRVPFKGDIHYNLYQVGKYSVCFMRSIYE